MDVEAVMFDLKAPCGNCPFLKAGLGGITGLHPGRVKEIAHAMTDGDSSFTCHKYSHRRKRDREHCVGAAVFSMKCKKPTTLMQLAERILGWNPREILRRNGKRVVGSVREFEKVQARGR